jgi:hypothetical protein
MLLTRDPTKYLMLASVSECQSIGPTPRLGMPHTTVKSEFEESINVPLAFAWTSRLTPGQTPLLWEILRH